MAIVHTVGVDKMCSIMAIDNEEIALATCNLFQCINDSLTGGDSRNYGKEEALVLGETTLWEYSFVSVIKSWFYYRLFFLTPFLLLD